MGGKGITLFASNRQKNKILNMFGIPYRYGKEFARVIIKPIGSAPKKK